MPVFCRPLSNVPSYAFPPRAFSRLSFRPLHVSPPAAPPLSPIPAPLLSLRLPVSSPVCRPRRLYNVRTRPCCLLEMYIAPLMRRRPRSPPHSVLVRRLHMLIYIAFGRRIVASSRDAPSPHRRPCLIAARIWRRLDLLVAWLREGRGEEHDMTNR